MDLENSHLTWEELGKRDPLWAVLTWKGKDKNKWDIDEFFKLGEWDIDRIFDQINKFSESVNLRYERSLDFGCGVGRLTIPLASRFKESYGVDIAPSMIHLADKFSQGIHNCRFNVNVEPSLKLYEDNFFNFIISLIVLQHIENEYQVTYIEEFIRVLTPGGLIVFQLPDEVNRSASYQKYDPSKFPEMEMHGINRKKVFDLITQCGGRILDTVEDDACGDLCQSWKYFVTK